jgi:hypothetical protein
MIIKIKIKLEGRGKGEEFSTKRQPRKIIRTDIDDFNE